MKRILQLALLTAVTFLSTSAHAYIYNESDVLLVFRKTGFNDVEFDIGSISNYLGKANGTVITVTNTTGLTNGWNFGLTRSNFNNSLAGVNFLLISATSLSDSLKRVWATDVDPNDVPLEVTPSTRTTIRSKIAGVGQAADEYTSIPPGSGGVPQPGPAVIPSGDAASYTTQTSVSSVPDQNLGGTLAFSVEGTIPTGAGTTTLRMFEIRGSAINPKPALATIGSFSLGTNGVLTFTAGTNATVVVPTISITDAVVTEGNAGTVTAAFTVSLSAATTTNVTVSYATADGTATAPSDYISTNGTLTFTPGIVSQVVNVTVKGDTLFEGAETFFVNLSNPTNATIADSQGQGTINNDDTAPSITINDVSAAEGNSGTANASFTVTLSAVSGLNVTVNYATANNSATAGSDYVSTNGVLTIPAGSITGTINVIVNGDVTVEANETYFVNLTSPVNASIADAQGLGTIVNDDSGGGGGPWRPLITSIVRTGLVNTVYFTTTNGSTFQLVTSGILSGSVSNWTLQAGTVAGNNGLRSLTNKSATNIFYSIRATTP